MVKCSALNGTSSSPTSKAWVYQDGVKNGRAGGWGSMLQTQKQSFHSQIHCNSAYLPKTCTRLGRTINISSWNGEGLMKLQSHKGLLPINGGLGRSVTFFNGIVIDDKLPMLQ